MESSSTTQTESILSTASLQLLLAKLSSSSSSPPSTVSPIENNASQPHPNNVVKPTPPTYYTSKMPYYDVDGQAVIAHVSTREIQSQTKTCRWDMHPYSTRTWLIPIALDSSVDDYIGEGNFCSLSCVKAYVLTHYDFVAQQEFIARIDDYATRHHVPLPILPAPPREFLPCFGTKYKSIDAFRAQATPQMQHCVDRFEFSQIHERAYPHMGQQCNLLETCEEVAAAVMVVESGRASTQQLVNDDETSFLTSSSSSSSSTTSQKKTSIPRKRRKKNDIE